jgi:group I intron endonuclease
MIIYKITNILNNKIYIGKTTKTLKIRWNTHLRDSKKNSNIYLYNAIKKYGKDNFIIEQIENCPDECGNDKEKYWIKYFNSSNKTIGYNITEGGDGGIKSEESKKRISESLKIYYKNHPPPYNPTKGKFGKFHQFYGKHHKLKIKQNLSKFRTGKKYEDIMNKSTSIKLKNMHREMWSGENNPAFKKFPIEEIIKNLHEFPLLTAQDISNNYKISYPTVIKKFKDFTGLTFEKYKKEKFGFNHGIYKHLKHLGIDKPSWTMYTSKEQYKMSCKHE